MDEMSQVDMGDGDPDQEDLAPLGEIPQDPENLAVGLMASDEGKAWLKKRATTAVKLVKADIESKKDWMDMREEQAKLYAGLVPRMKYPAAGARAPHDPIICRTILQMHTRGCDQITPAKGPLIQVHPVGDEDEEGAKKREEHMNWQFREKVPSYIAGVRSSFLQYLMSGSCFRERYYDPQLKVTCFSPLTADDVTVSYALKDIDPLMRRVPRVTIHLKYYKWEIEEKEANGEFPPGTVAKLYAKNGQGGSSVVREESGLEKQAQTIDGVIPTSTSVSINDDGDDSSLRVFHRIHMWMKLKGETKTSAVTFVVDDATSTPVILKRREKEDPFDKMRFEQEQQLWDIQAANDKAQYQAALAAWTQPGQMGEPPPQAMGQPEPVMPKPQPPPAPTKVIPRFDVIHYRLFENPNGFYGLGVAYLLTNANEMVNQLEGEYLIAARFASMQQGFLPKGAVPKSGEIRLEMGKFIQTELESNEMGGIKSFQFPGPSESLHRFIEGMKNDAYSLVADVDTLTGQAGPTNETKAAAEQRMSNATALMTAVSALWLETFKLEPQMLAEDNGLYMDDEEMYWLTEPNKADPTAQGQPVRKQGSARREDYSNPFDFTFTADQRLQTQPERVSTATTMIQGLTASPYARDPNAGPPLFHAAFSRLFRALDMQDMEKALGPAPPPPQPKGPPPPPVPMSQVQENQLFLQEQDHPVLPDDNHEEHLLVIDEFKQSPFEGQMTSTGKQIRDRHQRAHEAALYGQSANQGDQNGQQQGMGRSPGGGAPGVPGGPGIPGVPVGGPPPPGPGVGPPPVEGPDLQ